MEILKVDPEPDEDILSLEGKAAFDIMAGLLKKPEKKVQESKKPKNKGLPSCLMSLANSGARRFPCTMCGKLFIDPEQLVVHAGDHSGPKKNPNAECCFCGLCLGDHLKLTLHQIAMPLRHKCRNCLKEFIDFNELNHHGCEKRHERSRIKTGLVCKLGCTKERQFESEQALELHLFSLHGASMDDDPANNDAMKFCIMCRGFVNAYRLSLEDHTYFR